MVSDAIRSDKKSGRLFVRPYDDARLTKNRRLRLFRNMRCTITSGFRNDR